MKSRRDFLKTGLTLGAVISTPGLTGLLADETAAPVPAGPKPVLVAVSEGERVPMLDRALAELGGIGAFERPRQSVLIKPNKG